MQIGEVHGYPCQVRYSALSTLFNLYNSLYHAKAEFNNCYKIYSK